jgi:DNA-binding winged helix-turn-helix (wHTH) protein
MADPAPARRQYRFGPFILSPARRVLVRDGQELRLIPRYFDLLVLLVERRHEAVHRREIFDTVWSDVIVSDSALTQAVRILRRTLDDDPREPLYIRTVSRHGYRFVCAEVSDLLDEGPPLPAAAAAPESRDHAPADRVEEALTTLLAAETPINEDDDTVRREAAEYLHQTDTAAALARLDRRPGHERARAYLRDTRWDVAGAGAVPIFGVPGTARALAILFLLRLRRAQRLAEQRWLSASIGGGFAGLLAGSVGGAVLWMLPGSRMTSTVPAVLGVLGMTTGAVGAAGVGAGLAVAEVMVRSWRRLSLALFGALGGGAVGAAAHLVGQWTVQGLFGRDLSPMGGGFEGLVVGGAVGFGYALATPRPEGGMATPRGRARLRAALLTGLFGALAAGMLAATGSHLGAMSLDFMAKSFPGSQLSFDPLAHLLGEETPGPWTRIAISTGEGLVFGAGLAWGLTRRPRPRA